MRVRVTFTVDIDVDAWCTDYGISPDAVREDVKAYCEHDMTEILRDHGHLLATDKSDCKSP